MSVGYHRDFYRLFIYCLHPTNMITYIIRDNSFVTVFYSKIPFCLHCGGSEYR